MEVLKLKPSNFDFLASFLKSPTHTGLACIKNPGAEYFMLGPLEDNLPPQLLFLTCKGNYSIMEEPSNKYPETTWI